MTPQASIRAAAPVELPDALYRDLAVAYATPGRAYHTLDHVAEVARCFASVPREAWRRPLEVWLALLFHDAVYVPGASDNEAKSAELARAAGARSAQTADLDRVAELILLTARHGKLTPAEVDPEAALFLDCDMAILGADSVAFDAYDAAIAAEHAHVPPDLYRAGRCAFLAGLLARDRIFLSDTFHDRLDGRARENLRRALVRLG